MLLPDERRHRLPVLDVAYYGFILVGLWLAATGGYTAYKSKRAVDEYLRRNPDAT